MIDRCKPMGCAGRRVDYIREASDEYREMQDMESACERRQRDRRRDIVNERGALSNGPTCNPAGVAWLGRTRHSHVAPVRIGATGFDYHNIYTKCLGVQSSGSVFATVVMS